MDEYAWESYGDPKSLLAHLLKTGQAKDRKLRLWACACCRRLWELLGQGCRDYVALAERVADGEASAALISLAWDCAEAEREAERRPGRSMAACAACFAGSPNAESAAEYAPRYVQDAVAERAEADSLDQPAVEQRKVAERRAQLGLLRCVYANPFRPVALSPPWLTEDVCSLARAAYAERVLPRGELDTVRLAVLSDALEEAGAVGGVLNHLRSSGPRVRGCWALDLILGKS